jgi:hypothetical protein
LSTRAQRSQNIDRKPSLFWIVPSSGP